MGPENWICNVPSGTTQHPCLHFNIIKAKVKVVHRVHFMCLNKSRARVIVVHKSCQGDDESFWGFRKWFLWQINVMLLVYFICCNVVWFCDRGKRVPKLIGSSEVKQCWKVWLWERTIEWHLGASFIFVYSLSQLCSVCFLLFSVGINSHLLLNGGKYVMYQKSQNLVWFVTNWVMV